MFEASCAKELCHAFSTLCSQPASLPDPCSVCPGNACILSHAPSILALVAFCHLSQLQELVLDCSVEMSTKTQYYALLTGAILAGSKSGSTEWGLHCITWHGMYMHAFAILCSQWRINRGTAAPLMLMGCRMEPCMGSVVSTPIGGIAICVRACMHAC